jgi:ankyrin repeat protein
VKRLLQLKADINATDRNGEIPLHVAVRYNHFHIIELLIREGSDLNTTDAIGRSCLHCASAGGYHDIVQTILSNKLDDTAALVNGCDHNEISCLHLAAYGKHMKIVMILLDYGANVNKKDKLGNGDSTHCIWCSCMGH